MTATLPTELVCATASPAETRQLAAVVAATLRPGDVVALTGELGAGKTCFVQGAAAGLGVTERVTSPSFVLRREYEGPVPVAHLDVYRLDTLQDVVELGFEELLDEGRVTFVEWGDAMRPLLPADHLEVELRLPPLDAADEDRRLVLRPHGDDWRRRLAVLAPALAAWRAAHP